LFESDEKKFSFRSLELGDYLPVIQQYVVELSESECCLKNQVYKDNDSVIEMR